MNDKPPEMAVLPLRKLYTLAETIMEFYEINLLEDAYSVGLLDKFTVTQQHLDEDKFWNWADKPRVTEEVYWLGAPRHLKYRLDGRATGKTKGEEGKK